MIQEYDKLKTEYINNYNKQVKIDNLTITQFNNSDYTPYYTTYVSQPLGKLVEVTLYLYIEPLEECSIYINDYPTTCNIVFRSPQHADYKHILYKTINIKDITLPIEGVGSFIKGANITKSYKTAKTQGIINLISEKEATITKLMGGDNEHKWTV